MARVLIGYSACPLTRAAFEAHGHDVWTCDLLPARDNSPKHLQGDIWQVALNQQWDFAVLHPMCTYLTVSAAWAFTDGPYHQRVKPGTLTGAARREARAEAIEGVRRLLRLPYPKAIENPVGAISSAIRRPDQVIQPWQFGDDASKATCLWLDGLPKLTPTKIVEGRLVEWPKGSGKMVRRWANQTDAGQNRLSPSDDRAAKRSETYSGIAAAFAAQWGGNAFE